MIQKNILLFFSSVITISLNTSLAFAQFDSSAEINNERISYKVILIGDAGEPAKDIEEPVLKALSGEASTLSESTLVVFRGDNIYSNGLPPEDKLWRKEYEIRINELINIDIEAGANGIFIPGIHDWAQGNEEVG